MVSPSWARRVKQERDADPGQRRRPPGGSKPKLGVAARGRLDAWVAGDPDATLAELRARVAAELGVTVSIGCLFNTLRAMRLTYKESRSSPPSSGGPTSPRHATHASPRR